MKKFIMMAALLAAFTSLSSSAQTFKWSKVSMDGSRTGVTAPTSDKVTEAMGTFKGGRYVAPSGAVFDKKSATAKVAKLMIEAQPKMAFVKEVVGYAPEEMKKDSPESSLSNWFVDILMLKTHEATGRKVDIGITNFGGIRLDMPAGDVLYDDLQSMFPFNNTLCYVVLKGSEVRALFDKMAARSVQAVGGVKLVIKDRKVKSLLIGGEPVVDDRLYGVATISYLLAGGDDVAVARNAVEVTDTEIPIFEAVLSYVRELKDQGKYIEGKKDGRVVIEK